MRRPTTTANRQRSRVQSRALLLLCSLLLAQVATAQLGLDLGLGGLLDLTFDVGGSIAAATSLNSCSLLGGLLSITAPCTVSDLEWSAGNIQLGAQGQLQLTGQSNAYFCDSCGGAPLSLSGGSFGASGSGSLLLNSGASVALQGSSLNNAQLQLQDSANLAIQACNVAGGLSVQGSAGSATQIQGGTTVCNSACRFSAPIQVSAGGNLQASGSGQIQVGDNAELEITGGGALSCSGSCASGASSNVVVGASSGGVLSFTGSSPAICSAGVINLQGQSQLHVAAGATKQVAAATVITGSGSSNIAGTVNIAAPYTCDHASTSVASSGAVQIQGSGQLILNGGHSCNVAGGAQLQTSGATAAETHIVGCETCGLAASLTASPAPSGSGAAVVLGGGARVGLRSSGQVKVASGASLQVAGNAEFHGAGQLQVAAQGTHICAGVHTCNHAATVIAQGGNLQIQGTAGQYVCGAGHTLTLQGATVAHANVGSQNTLVIGANTAGAAAARVEVAPAARPTSINAGANIAINSAGQLHVQQGAALQFAGRTALSGAGSVNLEGQATCQDVVQASAPIRVQATGALAASGAGQLKISGTQATVSGGAVTGDTASALARSGSNFCVGGAAGSPAASLVFQAPPRAHRLAASTAACMSCAARARSRSRRAPRPS